MMSYDTTQGSYNSFSKMMLTHEEQVSNEDNPRYSPSRVHNSITTHLTKMDYARPLTLTICFVNRCFVDLISGNPQDLHDI